MTTSSLEWVGLGKHLSIKVQHSSNDWIWDCDNLPLSMLIHTVRVTLLETRVGEKASSILLATHASHRVFSFQPI